MHRCDGVTPNPATASLRRVLAGLALVAAMAACTPEAVDPAFDEEAGSALLTRYEAARSEADWEGAEAVADELRRRHGETQAAAAMRATIADVRAQAEARREERRLAGLWTYQKFAVDGGTQVSASIDSRIEWDPESDQPRPVPDAQLIFRRHPSWGDSAYLVLQQKALACGPPCRLEIRFDDGEPGSWAGKPADTGTGPALFIVDRDRFLAALDAAERVRIQLPRSEHLTPVFEFEVGGFDAARHARD